MSKQTVTVDTHNFEEEVLHAPQPVLVDFWAPWCGPCRMIAPSLEELASELAGRVKVAKVNVDDAPEVAERYRITSIPTLLLFQNGRVVGQKVGAGAKPAIAQFVEAELAASSARA
jgi:thioredoxin 1